MNNGYKRFFCATALALPLIALTGCSAGSKVYEFAEIPEPGSAVTVKLPSQLVSSAGEEETLFVESYDAKSKKLESGQYCAIDVTINYTEGSLETLSEPFFTQEEADEAAKEQIDSFFEAQEVTNAAELETKLIAEIQEAADDSINGFWGPETIEEYLTDRYNTTSLQTAAAIQLLPRTNVSEQFRDENGDYDTTATVQIVVDAVQKNYQDQQNETAQDAEGLPVWERVGSSLNMNNPLPAKAFADESSLETGSYFSEDLKSATLVLNCAASAYDPSTAVTLWFPTLTDDYQTTFAEAEITAMKSGDLSIVTGEINGWMVDANGEWIAR